MPDMIATARVTPSRKRGGGYNLDVLKAWDYAQTIYYSEKLQMSYIKAEKDTRKHIC